MLGRRERLGRRPYIVIHNTVLEAATDVPIDAMIEVIERVGSILEMRIRNQKSYQGLDKEELASFKVMKEINGNCHALAFIHVVFLYDSRQSHCVTGLLYAFESS